ncbi:Calx-beta domain-containing protein [Catellatospora sp. KI3]|uniref:Calx-beta domain-containing protein n=1 Tax=Catellatospora sp. KI3 TaxID=3041620 RepID=UPI002482EAC2|nr:Calx-beta domain-containing protein [Catellatospora sp. KI3]MDI1463270.1 Calx-beta domain-containing protein [Catellatospora sp. KI3]
MTMKSRMLPALVAGAVALATVIAATAVGDQPRAAADCQRSVAIDPQVTVSEAAATLTFTVYTASCAAAGSVSYAVTDGTAHRPGDFALAGGVLQWPAGDSGLRQIQAVIVGDAVTEALLEDFTVTLTNPSPDVRIAAATGRGRIFDNDTSIRAVTADSRLCLLDPRTSPPPSPSPTPSPKPDPGTVVPCTIEPGNIVSTPLATNNPSTLDQVVTVRTSDGDLTAGLDYVAVNRTLTVPAGQTGVYVPVQLLPHAFTQSWKYFNLTVTYYSGGTVVTGTAKVTLWR